MVGWLAGAGRARLPTGIHMAPGGCNKRNYDEGEGEQAPKVLHPPRPFAGAGEGSDDEDGDDAGMTNKQKKNKAKNERRLEQKQQRAKEAAEKRKKGNKLMEVGAGRGAGFWGPRYGSGITV